MKVVTNIYQLTELEHMLAEGYISVRQHPTAPLRKGCDLETFGANIRRSSKLWRVKS
jgi:hypothetical protein